MSKPLLSIGMIFKNEIRCLERCMKSLAPLREAVPCELVMADTGSTDGSHEIAEKYADILFDFPWIDDFAAARNAVMDRCSGTWYFSVDADEWLDEDLTELLYFLRHKKSWTGDMAGLIIRNYTTTDLGATGIYVEMVGVRFLRMSTGIRYTGAIHEMWEPRHGAKSRCVSMRHQILHHDGYVGMNTTVAGALKRHRNITLLKKTLENHPDSLRTWLQCIESSNMYPDHIDYIRGAIKKVQEKIRNWDIYGPPILRHAIDFALQEQLPEAEEWRRMAEEWFPDSLFTTLDVGYLLCKHSWEKSDYPACIRQGRAWLGNYAKYTAGEGDQSELLVNALQRGSPRWEAQIKIYLANAYLFSKDGHEKETLALLRTLDATTMDPEQIGNTVRAMTELHAVSDLDTSARIKKFYKELTTPKPTEKAAEERRKAFEKEALTFFTPHYIQTESFRTDSKRRAATLFAPLECDIGTAASLLLAEDKESLERLLEKIEDWSTFPPAALTHALSRGVTFPLPGRPLDSETMDALAIRLSGDQERFFSLVRQTTESHFTRSAQTLAWTKSLVLAALQVNDWGKDTPEESNVLYLDAAPGWTDRERGMALARAFAAVERAFLPLCYTPDVLVENQFLLPPMHRFGWHMIRTVDALDGGNMVEAVRSLRAGLASCQGMKPMVEALLKEIEAYRPPAPPEMLALAEQIRTLLASYAPDDPAVAALKASPAYQEAAYLIEGPELGIYGGLPQ